MRSEKSERFRSNENVASSDRARIDQLLRGVQRRFDVAATGRERDGHAERDSVARSKRDTGPKRQPDRESHSHSHIHADCDAGPGRGIAVVEHVRIERSGHVCGSTARL